MINFVFGFFCAAAILNPIEAKGYALQILHGIASAVEFLVTALG